MKDSCERVYPFTVMGLKTSLGHKDGNQRGVMTEYSLIDLRVGKVGVFDEIYGLCRIVKIYENKHPYYGWFLAEKIYLGE